MKKILLLRFMCLMFIVPLSLSLQAQNPTYLCELRNDLQISSTVFEFDIYLLRTGSNAFEYAAGQFGILINPSVKNGGTIIASIVPWSSDAALLETNQNPNSTSFQDATDCIRIAGRTPPGVGNGAIISDISPGTRVCRVRLTNSVPFGQFQPDLTWTTSTIYPTAMSAYVSGTNTLITDYPSHTTSNLFNPTLNPIPTAFAVTGGGSYCQGSPGLPVGLADSESGVTYTLFKDLVVQPLTYSGTGSALNFGNKLAGSYTVSGTNESGTTYMTGNAVITENAVPTITGTTPGSRCGTGPVTLGATASVGTVNWYSASTGGTLLGSGISYTTPSISSTTTCWVDATNDGCTTGSRTGVTATVNALPAQPTITAGGPTTFCTGGSVTLTSSTGTTYLWSTGATTASIIVTTAGSFTVRITNSAGCQSASSDNVIINTLPTPGAPLIGAITQPTLTIPTGSVVLNDLPATGSWTLIRTPDGTTTPGSGASTTISDLPPGIYTYTVIDAMGCISPASANVVVNAVPSTHFVPVWWPGSGMDHMNLYALTAKLDNLDLQPGDEIGIFDGSACVGMGTITQVLNGTTVYLSMVASKDDPDTPSKDGYTQGNPVTYRVWDLSATKEVSNAVATYTSGVGIFSPGTTSTFNLNAITSITQDISLTAGWNIMSFAGEPDNMSLSSIVNSLKIAGTLVKIQDEKGNAIEQLPAPIGWVDNIGLMYVSEGYKIKVSANTTLSVTGKPVTLPYTIDLSTGWNIMGYPSMSSQAAMAAFQSLINAGTLLKVQDEKGNAIEQLPAPIGWVDNIHTLAAGEGYKVKVSAATSITINNSGKGEYESAESVAPIKPSHFKPAYGGNGFDHMNIYLKEATIGGVGIKTGDEIGVFDGGVCVGAVVVDNPNSEYIMMTASLDDPTTTETDGFIAGHDFTLKLWDRQSGIERNSQNVQFEKGSGRLFERFGTSVLAVDFETKAYTSLGDAYPNPSTDKTTFTFQLAGESKVRLEIFNMKGDLIKVFVDDKMPGGLHQIEWDNRSTNGIRASSGIYFYKLILNNFTQTKQLVIK